MDAADTAQGAAAIAALVPGAGPERGRFLARAVPILGAATVDAAATGVVADLPPPSPPPATPPLGPAGPDRGPIHWRRRGQPLQTNPLVLLVSERLSDHN